MPSKHPISYELEPRTLPRTGVHWQTLRFKNVGQETLHELDIRMNSLDTYCVRVLGKGTYVSQLEPGKEIERQFQISIDASSQIYLSIDAQRDGEPFHWESLPLRIQVGGMPAEIESFFALSEPGVLIGETVPCEATVLGRSPSSSLILEFWVEQPDGETVSPDKEGVGRLKKDERRTITFEFEPSQEGIYILHAYLYQRASRVDRSTDYVSVAR